MKKVTTREKLPKHLPFMGFNNKFHKYLFITAHITHHEERIARNDWVCKIMLHNLELFGHKIENFNITVFLGLRV
jgi:hypothetical protein